MKARIKKGIAAATAVACATAALIVGSASSSTAQPVSQTAYGITSDGRLMAMFTTDRPDVLNWVRVITGLQGDQFLVGIDIRVQDRLIYGLGSAGGVYTITTPPATTDVVVRKVSQLSVPLYGTNFGVDFNPAADRLRVISDNGQNLRHNLNDHTTIEDGTLTRPPQTGPARGVTAAAYTNNDLNPDTVTTQFDIDTTFDQVVIQSPPNNGFLVPTGALGVDATPNTGLDIYSDLTNGKTTSATAFLTTGPPTGQTTLSMVNLLTGAATSVGQFPLPITDIAVALDAN